MSAVIGAAGRADDSEEIEVRITVGTRRLYRVLAADVPFVLAGYSAVLYSEEGEPIGDIESSASGRMLIGASRAGHGFGPGRRSVGGRGRGVDDPARPPPCPLQPPRRPDRRFEGGLMSDLICPFMSGPGRNPTGTPG